MKESHYQILGINQNADASEIKNAFRKLAKKYHPDVNADNPDAEKKFRDINEAYRILSDETLKREYDESLKAPYKGNGPKVYDTSSRKKPKVSGLTPDFMNVNTQFADFFGFKPR